MSPRPVACGRVSCSHGTAIWWCNDVSNPGIKQDREFNPFQSRGGKTLSSFGSIVDGAQHVWSSWAGRLFMGLPLIKCLVRFSTLIAGMLLSERITATCEQDTALSGCEILQIHPQFCTVFNFTNYLHNPSPNLCTIERSLSTPTLTTHTSKYTSSTLAAVVDIVGKVAVGVRVVQRSLSVQAGGALITVGMVMSVTNVVQVSALVENSGSLVHVAAASNGRVGVVEIAVHLVVAGVVGVGQDVLSARVVDVSAVGV